MDTSQTAEQGLDQQRAQLPAVIKNWLDGLEDFPPEGSPGWRRARELDSRMGYPGLSKEERKEREVLQEKRDNLDLKGSLPPVLAIILGRKFKPSIPTVLAEVGFTDEPSDPEKLTENLLAAVQAGNLVAIYVMTFMCLEENNRAYDALHEFDKKVTRKLQTFKKWLEDDVFFNKEESRIVTEDQHLRVVQVALGRRLGLDFLDFVKKYPTWEAILAAETISTQ